MADLQWSEAGYCREGKLIEDIFEDTRKATGSKYQSDSRYVEGVSGLYADGGFLSMYGSEKDIFYME